MQIESRTRYNIWDLLADVGGFYDGLFLVIGILYAPFGLIAFKADFFNRTPYDGMPESADKSYARSP